jgi:sulfatase maturation enzyme AslB (radical SAM superfamily)
MLYTIDEIRHVHLEISSLCNAECPLCPRNLHGYPYNGGYVERNLSLSDIKKIFEPEFLSQLTEININGNFGDIVMNPEAVDIIAYVRQYNSTCVINISTNAGARNQEFWTSLAQLNCRIFFCLDGLEDTHSLYRKNTLYSTVLNNAKVFIQAGGEAWWKMIEFDHNRHQIDIARQLSQDLGFANFQLINHGRNSSPVFDRQGKLTHVIGAPGEINFQKIHQARTDSKIPFTPDGYFVGISIKPILCQAKTEKSIYITSEGEVYPCCWLGMSPNSYLNSPFDQNSYLQAANSQVRPLISNNNALQHRLQDCIEWFNLVEQSWQQPDFKSGYLATCNAQCGIKNEI